MWVCITLTGCTFPAIESSNQADSVTAATVIAIPSGAAVQDSSNAPESLPKEGGICNRAAPGHPLDVSVEDGMVFQPGVEFTKTWRLVNVGNCVWSEDYSIVWFSGEPMGSARILYLDAPVLPGASVDLSVEMVAPLKNGSYQSNWKIRNAEGVLFGLGPQGDAPFWVRISVFDGSVLTATPTPIHTPTPIVYKQGEVAFVNALTLDVDRGGVDTGDDDDISLVFEDDKVTVMPLGNVKLGLPSIGAGMRPSQNGCIVTPLSADEIILDALTEDVFICYQSSQGLPGYLWLQTVEADAEYPGIAFVTWFIP